MALALFILFFRCTISNKRQSEVVIKLTTIRNHGVYSILD
jgi:hypothetical protein